jgi:hypothetical protein
VLVEMLTEFGGVMVRNWQATTIASPMAVRFSPMRTKPVAMALRTCRSPPDGDESSPIRATRSRPACTARSASSSRLVGYPNNARISSHTEWTIAPPHCVTTEVHMPWKQRTVLPRSSGSKWAASAAAPTNLHDKTVS